MGYTHYWEQTRSFTHDEWEETSKDLKGILAYVEHQFGVPLANAMGKPGTRPKIDQDNIVFNGLGDDSHETFAVNRQRQKAWISARPGADFCKTAREPYDVAVTACLCYLASVSETHTVTSDGRGNDFVLGLDTARKAVPAKANVLDIPVDIMREDRWTGPWVRWYDDYKVRFSVDGYAYVEQTKDDSWYRFSSLAAACEFLTKTKEARFRSGGGTPFGPYGNIEPDIWNAAGVFDEKRHKRLAAAQKKVLSTLFDPLPAPNNHRPLAFVRPGDYIRPEDNGAFCYSLAELITRLNP